MRGQVAFEALFLVLVILSATVLITSEYIPHHDDTVALALARTETLSQLSTQPLLVTIDSVTLTHTGTATTITIRTTPAFALNTQSIKAAIQKQTHYTNLVITLAP